MLNVRTVPQRTLWSNSLITEGEFHVDLYTLPDSLVRMLWDFCVEKLGS